MSRWSLLLIAGAMLVTLFCAVFAVADDDTDPVADGGAAGSEGAGIAEAAPTLEPEFPILIVHKDVSETDTVPGTAVTVTLTVFNIGTASAFDVKLTDKAPFEGDQTASIAELEVGSNLTHTYVVTPKTIGRTALPIAEVTYKASSDAKAETLKAVSNEVREELRDDKLVGTMEVGERGFINVVTPEEYERMHTKHYKEYIIYAVFCAIAIYLPYSQGKAVQKKISTLIREARKSGKN